MSPDPINGDSYDRQSEVYCLGCVLFESLTGKPPFVGETALEILSMHARNLPPALEEFNDSISVELSNVVLKCLQKKKDLRYRSLEEFRLDLEGAVQHDEHSDTKSQIKASSKRSRVFLWVPVVVLAMGCFFNLPLIFVGFQSPLKKITRDRPVVQQVQVTLEPSKDFLYAGCLTPILSSGKYTDKDLKYVAKELLQGNDLDKGASPLSIQNDLKGRETLINLDLSGFKLDGSGLKYLTQLPIETLVLPDSGIESKYLKELHSLPLTRLFVGSTYLSKADLEALAGIRTLRLLNLDSCRKLDEDGMKSIANMSYLRDICLNGTNVSDRTFQYLSSCRSLRFIAASDTAITNQGLKAISNLHALTTLCLNNCKNLDSESISIISENFPDIRCLDIGEFQLKPGDLILLEACPRLSQLKLQNLNLNDSDLQSISSHRNLYLLILRRSSITDSSLKWIAGCQSLRELQLYSCPNLTAEGLNSLAQKLGPRVKLVSDKYHPNVDEFEQIYSQ